MHVPETPHKEPPRSVMNMPKPSAFIRKESLIIVSESHISNTLSFILQCLQGFSVCSAIKTQCYKIGPFPLWGVLHEDQGDIC